MRSFEPCLLLTLSLSVDIMQAIILAVAVLCLLCTSLASAQSEPQLLLQGRFGGSVDENADLGTLPLMFSWPSSSVYLTFHNSSKISATISALTPTHASAGYYTRFAFYLDQQQISVESTNPDNTVIYWNATGLTLDEHNLTITKVSEASYGEASLTSLTLASGGSFLSPAAPAALLTGRRIQIIGDSYTVGLGNVGNSACNAMAVCRGTTCMPPLEAEDTSQSWGVVVADQFSADYELIAWTGAGLVTYSYAQSAESNDNDQPAAIQQAQYPKLNSLWERQVAADSTSIAYNLSSWTPQIVLMAAGPNDFHLLPATPVDVWRNNYIEFLDMLNQEYGDPQIILVVMPQEVPAEGASLGPNFNDTTTYIEYMANLYTASQMEGLTNVHLLQLDALGMPLADWCDGHPNVAADANIAGQVSAYINAVLPSWANTTYPTVNRVDGAYVDTT